MRRLFMRSDRAEKLQAGKNYFAPTALIGIIAIAISLVVVLPKPAMHSSATAAIAQNPQKAAAQAPNPNCTLIVPANPLSAQGLATPYQLTTASPQNGPCNETNKKQAAFVEGAVFDPDTGTISIYDPLVIDLGSQPAVAPAQPTLPPHAVVALWFGFNGDTLILQGADPMALSNGNCVNGAVGSIFGQFSYCNAPDFFKAVYGALTSGKLTAPPPPLGTGQDGLPCPTVRDFGIVDQDQSDNVTTQYLVTPTGQLAQHTAANLQMLVGTQSLSNGSDNRLVTVVDKVLGCQPWTAPDLADPTQKLTALPLNEIQAQVWQNEPVALVPNDDPMVLVNGQPDLAKLNLYRQGVGQPLSTDASLSSTMAYCANLVEIAPKRLQIDQTFTLQGPSPDPTLADSLFTFLAQRFNATWGKDAGLDCQGRLNLPSPITLKADAAGVTISATITVMGDRLPGAQNGTTNDNNTTNDGNTNNGTDQNNNKKKKKK